MVAVGSFTHVDVAGANRFRFTGTIKGRGLKPGSYTMRSTANIGQLTSKPIRASFRINAHKTSKRRGG